MSNIAYSSEVENMCCVAKGPHHGPAPIPEEGKWVKALEIKDISGLTHGIGWCAPQQGACKLTLNVKDGIIEEALVETIGCSGMTHSAAMASAFSEGGLTVGAGLEDLGKGSRSQVGTLYGTRAKGVRYLEMTEGYITRMALDSDDQVIGYEFVSLGKMTDFIKKGMEPGEAYKKSMGTYGRFDEAVKYIDPRCE